MIECYGTLWQREKLTDIPEYGIALTSDGDIKYVPERTTTYKGYMPLICDCCGAEVWLDSPERKDNGDINECELNYCPNCGSKAVDE